VKPSSARTSQWSALNALGAIRVVALVLRADYLCTYCATKPPKGRRHIDHVVPRSEGGSDDAGNLVLACSKCNLGRIGRLDGIPERAHFFGRTKRQIDRAIAAQIAVSIEPGSELYERARRLAPVGYPEHFERKDRARAAWRRRAADAFDFGANVQAEEDAA